MFLLYSFAFFLIAYMSAKTDLFLGRENLDAITAIVCLEMPCIVGWMASLCMTWSFAAGEFWTDYVCSKMHSDGGSSCRGQSVGLRWESVDCFIYAMGFYWEVFLNRLLDCYYFHLLKLSLSLSDIFWSVEDICGLQLSKSLLFLLLLLSRILLLLLLLLLLILLLYLYYYYHLIIIIIIVIYDYFLA